MQTDVGAHSSSGVLVRHALPLSLALLSIAAAVGGPQLRAWLRYDRTAILDGEAWRLLSAHVTHLGWGHLAMNLAGLILIWMLFGRLYSTRQWLSITLFCMIGISLGILALQPGVHWYAGLSGLLHGLFVAGALASLAAGYRAELALLGLLIAKLTWEQLHGALPGSAEFAGGSILVESHLYGAITGLLAAALILIRARCAGKPAS
ncbi:MAG: rhombosortase [Gammaproteobacteria bacterium]|nr:rhombosortase [Gammaproteobacteria bacterium]